MEPHGDQQAFSLRDAATGPARHLLHQVYYAQRAYRDQQKRWAGTFKDLGVEGLSDASLVKGSLRLEATTSLWEASAVVEGQDPPRRVHIRQDSLVWETKEKSK